MVKVERPGGDPLAGRPGPLRRVEPGQGSRSSSTCADRRAAREALDAHRRAPTSLIENLRPGRARPARPVARRAPPATPPGLVTCSITRVRAATGRRGRPGMGAARARPGRRAAGPVHRRRADLAAVPDGQRRRRAAGGARRRRRAGQARRRPATASTSRRRCSRGCSSSTPAPIFHRERHRPGVVRHAKSPILRVFDTADGRAVHGQPERHRALARAVPAARAMDDGGLDYSTPDGLAKLSDREWNRRCSASSSSGSPARPPTSGRRRCSRSRPRWPSATPSRSGWRTSRPRPTSCVPSAEDPVLGRGAVGRPARTDRGRRRAAPRPGRRHGGGAGRARRAPRRSTCRASGPDRWRRGCSPSSGADVVKVEPPGGEGAYQLMPMLPNIYVDGNRSKRGVVARPRRDEDRRRLLDLVAAADVVVENAMAGAWERLGLDEAHAAGRQPGAGLRPGQGLRPDGPAGRHGRRSTTSCRPRPAWR